MMSRSSRSCSSMAGNIIPISEKWGDRATTPFSMPTPGTPRRSGLLVLPLLFRRPFGFLPFPAFLLALEFEVISKRFRGRRNDEADHRPHVSRSRFMFEAVDHGDLVR